MVFVLEILIGFSSGAVAGSAIAAFYSALGFYSKPVLQLTRGQRTILAAASVTGAAAGAYCYYFSPFLGGGLFAEAVFGLFSGLFTGIYIALIAEVLEYIPFLRRIGVHRDMIYIVLIALAAGKFVGQLYFGFVK